MSNTHVISLKRSTALLLAVTLLSLLTVVNFSAFFGKASAADLTSRSLSLSSTLSGTALGSGTPGDADNGSEARHSFTFTPTTTGHTSVTFEYCTDAIGTCTLPTGLVVPSTPIVVGGGGTAAFATRTITWTPGSTLDTTAVTVSFGDIVNPTYIASPTNPDDNTFFVRITATGGAQPDEGTVASAITEGITITARVAETLGFSTTGSFAGVGAPGSNCMPVTGSGAIRLGDATEGTLSLTQAYDNYSAFRIYTNASEGVDVQYAGETLTRTSGGDIDAMGAAALASDVGTEQFGLAIDTSVGGNNAVSIASSASTLDMANVTTEANLALNGGLTPLAGVYDNGEGTITDAGAATFAFVAGTPTTIASSDGYVECKTAAVRYMANISPTTTSGTYTTTIVYSAVPKY